jgi:hypothetical protein
MPVKLSCPCGKVVRVRDELLGKKVKCPDCGKPVLVEEPAEEEEEESPPPRRAKAEEKITRKKPPVEDLDDEEPPPPRKTKKPDKAKPRSRNEEEEDEEEEADEEEERPRKKGRKQARKTSLYLWLGLAGGGVLVAAGVVVLILVLNKKDGSDGGGGGGGGPVAGEDKQAETDLKMLGLAYHNALNNLGRPPANKEDLKQGLEPQSHGIIDRYVVVWNLSPKTVAGKPDVVMAYETKVPTQGGMVLFFDLSIRKVTADEFKKFRPK